MHLFNTKKILVLTSVSDNDMNLVVYRYKPEGNFKLGTNVLDVSILVIQFVFK